MTTRPGGLTIAEASALGTAFASVDPIPGHEMGNARFLRDRYGIPFCETPMALRALLGELMADRARLADLRRASARLGRPDAARDCAHLILDLARGVTS